MDTRIRIATDADLLAITDIYNQAIALGNATAHTLPVTVKDREAWLAGHPPESEPVYVAETDGHVVGYCSITAYRPGRQALSQTKEISYFVSEDHRGQGVGSALIKYTLSRCRSLGIKTLFAILLDNNPASVGLLEKFKFEQWGHMPNVAEFGDIEVGHLYYGRRV